MGNGASPHGPSYRAHPRLYHRADSLRCEGADAIGAKRTCRERRERVDLTKMTPSGHWPMPALICGREYYGMSAISVGSVRLDVGELHHLGPFLGFVDDESAEVGGRTRKRCASQVGKPGLHLGIGESAI